MKIFTSTLALLAGIATVGAANANEVLLTDGVAKNSGAIALDVVSSGNATAFQFSIPLQNSSNQNVRQINPKQINLTNCVADIPSTHVGHCMYRAKANDILVLVYSPKNELLPEGVVGVGTINAPASMAKSFKVTDVEFASPEAKRLD